MSKLKKIITFLILPVGLFLLISALPSHAVNVTFTDLNGKLLGSVLTAGPASTVGTTFDILNNTGVTWTDFHYGIGSPAGGNVFFSLTDPYQGPGTATVDITPPSIYGTMMDVISISIPDGSTYSAKIGAIFGEAPFAVVAGYPTIDSIVPPDNSVPEPATMLLFCTGLAGLAGYRKMKAMKK